MPQIRKWGRLAPVLFTLMVAGIMATACHSNIRVTDPIALTAFDDVIPKPVFAKPAEGAFALTEDTAIYVAPDSPELMQIGRYLADKLMPATGFAIPVLASGGAPPSSGIILTTLEADVMLGDEGYELMVSPETVTLRAPEAAGLFRGTQTIRQLLPHSIDSATVQPGPWAIPAGTIRDYPRFAWRGVMLDVSRHFFGVEDVMRYIDLAAYYKMNRFHMHLADDQGWRLMIHSWPNLALHGGSTQVGGGPGGYYTQEEFAAIVAYAASRYIIIVPEIDMPGHTNAALASYPELNCDGVAPPLYTGTEVGFSSLCIDKEITYKFIDDVIGELAALTPGPWIHVGGDEAHATKQEDYQRFMTRVQEIIASHGKRMVGWEEIAQIELSPESVAQHWHSDLAQQAARQEAKVIMSPASRAYLDMKYHRQTELGLKWAGYVSVEKGYSWDPATQLTGVAECDVLGVEGPLWAETIETMDDIEFLAFPRLLGLAEIGWSPAWGRSWEEYRERLGRHGARLEALDVDFYPCATVPWP